MELCETSWIFTKLHLGMLLREAFLHSGLGSSPSVLCYENPLGCFTKLYLGMSPRVYVKVELFCMFLVNRKKLIKDRLSPYLQHGLIVSEENVVLCNVYNTIDDTSVVYVLFCSGMLNRTKHGVQQMECQWFYCGRWDGHCS